MLTRYAVVIILILAAISSCAYYNIYWTAEKEYAEAVSKVEGLDFRDPFVQPKLEGQSAKLIDSCIRRCGKLLLLYPGSRWVDDTLLLMGNCYVLKKDYANAIRKYDELINLYAESELAVEARYMKAYTLVLDGSEQQAVVLLEDLYEDTRRENVREKTAYLLARVAVSDQDCEAAIPHMEAYIRDFPRAGSEGEIRLELARCLLETGSPERTIEVLENLQKRNDIVGALAGMRVGAAYRKKGDVGKAVEVFSELARKAPEESLQVRAKMEVAHTLVLDGQAEAAITRLEEARELCGDGLQDLKAEVLYQTALTYEKHLGDFEKAAEAYDESASSKTPFGKKAEKRSGAIRAISRYQEVLRDSLVESEEDKAKNQFLMAETYLHDMGLRQEALRHYKEVSDSFPSTTYAARSMLAVAGLLRSEGDTTASTYYWRVLELFPKTTYANVARSNLDLPLEDVEIGKGPEVSLTDSTVSGPDTAGVAPDTTAVPLPPRRAAPSDTLEPEPEPVASERGDVPGRLSEPQLRHGEPPGVPADTAEASGVSATSDSTWPAKPEGDIDSLMVPEPEDTSSSYRPEGRPE
jgi:tetratricopeptide (TPR) repeat protein